MLALPSERGSVGVARHLPFDHSMGESERSASGGVALDLLAQHQANVSGAYPRSCPSRVLTPSSTVPVPVGSCQDGWPKGSLYIDPQTVAPTGFELAGQFALSAQPPTATIKPAFHVRGEGMLSQPSGVRSSYQDFGGFAGPSHTDDPDEPQDSVEPALAHGTFYRSIR